MKIKTILILLLSSQLSICKILLDDGPCGDWTPYKDEKCLKIIDPNLLDYTNAENICNNEDGALLPSVTTEEKQKFMEDLLGRQNVVDNVWIGLKYVNQSYVWVDGTAVDYTHWGSGSPSNDSDYCVQMEAEKNLFGYWTDTACTKKNIVMCEKIQLWSLSKLQSTIVNMQLALANDESTLADVQSALTNVQSALVNDESKLADVQSTLTDVQSSITDVQSALVNDESTLADVQSALTDVQSALVNDESTLVDVQSTLVNDESTLKIINSTLANVQSTLVNLQSELSNDESALTDMHSTLSNVRSALTDVQSTLTNVVGNPVPIGFIYVQLPREKAPQQIWPGIGWKDVSSDYAGLFFRTEGGKSGSFGDIQNESSPRMATIKGKWHGDIETPYPQSISIPHNGEESDYLWTSVTYGNHYDGIRTFKFQLSKEEVCPRNTAIRIWKRIS